MVARKDKGIHPATIEKAMERREREECVATGDLGDVCGSRTGPVFKRNEGKRGARLTTHAVPHKWKLLLEKRAKRGASVERRGAAAQTRKMADDEQRPSERF